MDRDTYINSSINVIDSLQVGPEMIYGEKARGCWRENWTICRICCVPTACGCTTKCRPRIFFILTWMTDAEKAEAKVASLQGEEGSLACVVDLKQEWHREA